MRNWQRKRLKDVVIRWMKGSTPPRSRTEYYVEKNGIPWVRVSDLKGGTLTKTELSLTREGAEEIKEWVPKGAVLLSVSGTIGRTAIAGTDLKLNQAVQGIVFDERLVLAEYAYYYFQFFRPWLEKRANAVTITNLTRSQLENTSIVFPCLAEQKMIVKSLKSAELIKERQANELASADKVISCMVHQKLQRILGTPDIDRLEKHLEAYISEEQTEAFPEDIFIGTTLPEERQEKIISVIQHFREMRQRMSKQKSGFEYLYKNLLASAFTGDLTENFRRTRQLEEPENGFFFKHYLAKHVEKTEERYIAEEESWRHFFTAGQREIMRYLSPFQEELLQGCVKTGEPVPIHVVFKQINRAGGDRFKRYSIQDALISAKLLEGLGFLESTGGEKIFLEGEEILDSYQRPITIRKYQIPDRN